MNRRKFLKDLGIATAAIGAANLPLSSFARSNSLVRLTILHTNDTHSRIEPFPENSKYAGLGGFAKRAAIIDEIRKTEENVLLLDAGDIFQGTPYFNIYGGELEYKLMSEMKYDAATLGNHDFDAGIEGLIRNMPFASFSFVNCNYDFTKSALVEKILPYKVIQKKGVKIGITGVGIELDGLVPAKLFGDIIYKDPISNLNKTAAFLKKNENCDLVICLSHLGYEYSSEKISDVKLAAKTENVDIILGGHTHTFLDKPVYINNLKEQPVLINQVGWAGIVLGRIDIHFEKQSKKNNKKIAPVIFSEKTIVK